MPQFKVLSANFHVSTMVEHGTLAFFLDGNQIISARDSIDTKLMMLEPGKHTYQWQVNGKDDLTRYSVRMTSNGAAIPGTGVGPRKLKGGETDFSGGEFQVS